LLPIELKLPFSELISKVSCGSYHIFILSSNSKCFCFGENDRGQLGLGDNKNRNELVELTLSKSNSRIKKIICGSCHTFILTKDSKCFCFGKNNFGQLGLGDNENRSELVEFQSPNNETPIKKIKCGDNHSFIQTSDLKWYAFGYTTELEYWDWDTLELN